MKGLRQCVMCNQEDFESNMVIKIRGTFGLCYCCVEELDWKEKNMKNG